MIVSPEDKEKIKNRWIDLALLYKDIDEPEIFQNVYLTNVATDDIVKHATNAEIRGDYVEAFNSFKKATDDLSNDTYESNLWEEQKLYCYTQLTQWEDIAYMVNSVTNNDPVSSIWDPQTKVNNRSRFCNFHIK
jgi:DNA-dependent protein kinase catalytic subunit